MGRARGLGRRFGRVLGGGGGTWGRECRLWANQVSSLRAGRPERGAMSGAACAQGRTSRLPRRPHDDVASPFTGLRPAPAMGGGRCAAGRSVWRTPLRTPLPTQPPRARPPWTAGHSGVSPAASLRLSGRSSAPRAAALEEGVGSAPADGVHGLHVALHERRLERPVTPALEQRK